MCPLVAQHVELLVGQLLEEEQRPKLVAQALLAHGDFLV